MKSRPPSLACHPTSSYTSILAADLESMSSLSAPVEADSSRVVESDDTFTLYDLRVEAVCPIGQRVMCGAKDGDYFTLEGEMMYLPAGQGISIYSLGTVIFTFQ